MRKTLAAADYSSGYHRAMMRSDKRRGARTALMELRIWKFDSHHRATDLIDQWAGLNEVRGPRG